MKLEIEIRPMAAGDLDRVLAIAGNLPQAPHWPQSAYLNAINPDSTPRRIALVAAGPHPGSILGFAIASLLPPQAELESIAVAPESQRRGLGESLFQALAAELKAAGVGRTCARSTRLEPAGAGFLPVPRLRQNWSSSGLLCRSH